MSLRLYADKGNLASLKVLVSARVNKVKVEVDNNVDGCSERLPVLHISEHTQLFSANTAVRYLFVKFGNEDKDSVDIDSVLEWEASQLQANLLPYLVNKVVHNKRADSSVTDGLSLNLKHLDGMLSSKDFLVQDGHTVVSSADVVVWCALYPVLSDENLAPNDVGQNVLRWYRNLAERSEFKEAVRSLTEGRGVSALKDSLARLSISPIVTKSSSHMTKTKAAPPVVVDQKSENDEVSVSEADLQCAKQAWLTGHTSVPAPREQKHPKQPVQGERNILITSALPYVNNVPHLGNIIGCVLSADVFSRYCRLRNYNCLYLCGTDEYGTATETKALAEGLTPQQICDKYNQIHTDVYKWFNIDFDHFGRTTTEWQTKISQDIFWKLYNNGYILKDSVEQLRCDHCERFLADRFVEGTCPLCKYEDARGDQCDGCGKLLNATDLLQPRCKLCSQKPCVKSSNHLFLDLPKLTDKLSAYLDTRFTGSSLWSANAKLITKSWLRDGLKPRCITRDLWWGTPVPLDGYTDKVFYVWFDAPIGYLSIGASYHDDWELWWKRPDEVELYQFMAKDNVPFHSVIFPASLLGTGDNYTLVAHLSATEYLNYEDTKFSKSRGTGVFGNDASDTQIPADIWRFYLLFVRPESQDSSFSWDDFMTKNNTELLNNLGNFINRALTFVINFFGGAIPEMSPGDEDYHLLALITAEIRAYLDDLEHLRLRDGLRKILNISRLGNQYMQANKPWVLVKGATDDKVRAGTVVGIAANVSCLISVLLQPYMPEVSATIQTQLAAPSTCNYIGDKFVCYLRSGHKIGTPSPLFTKLESKSMDVLKKKYAGKQQTQTGGKDAGKARTNGDVTPVAVTSPPVTSQDVDALNAQITEQGNVVRQLKTAKADKEKIAVEVEKLLTLKKQLAAVTGVSPEPATGSKKKKNKRN